MIKKYLRDILKHSFFYSFGPIINSFMVFLLIPIYTNIFSLNDYGILVLVNIIITVILSLSNIGMNSALNIIYFKNNKKGIIIGSSFWFLFFNGIIILVLFSVFDHLLSKVILQSDIPGIFIYIGIINLINLINIPQRFILKKEKRSFIFSLVSIISAISLPLFQVIFLYIFEKNIISLLQGYLCSKILIFFILFIINKRNMNYGFSITFIKKLAIIGIPFVISSISAWIFSFSDRIIIGQMLSNELVGIYDVMYKYSFAFSSLMISIFPLIWNIVMFEIEKEKGAKKIYATIFDNLLSFILVITTLLLFLSYPLLQLLTSKSNYMDYYELIPILIVSSIFNPIYYYIIFAMSIKQKIKIYIPTISSGIINIIMNIILIPIIGISGAIISTLLSYILLILTTLYLSQKIYYVPYNYKKILMKILIFIVINLGYIIIWAF